MERKRRWKRAWFCLKVFSEPEFLNLQGTVGHSLITWTFGREAKRRREIALVAWLDYTEFVFLIVG